MIPGISLPGRLARRIVGGKFCVPCLQRGWTVSSCLTGFLSHQWVVFQTWGTSQVAPWPPHPWQNLLFGGRCGLLCFIVSHSAAPSSYSFSLRPRIPLSWSADHPWEIWDLWFRGWNWIWHLGQPPSPIHVTRYNHRKKTFPYGPLMRVCEK